MRILTAFALALSLLLVSPAEANPKVRTGITLVAAHEGGIIGFMARRYEESPHGRPVLASGYVRLELKSEKTNWRWKVIPRSRTLAYKGRARWFYQDTSKPGLVRAVSIGGGGYLQSYSKPVKLPLR
jgi:hypothetical protein